MNHTLAGVAIAATTLLTIAACSNEQELPQSSKVIVTLTAGISNKPVTRVDYTDPGTGSVALAWSEGDKFSLYRKNGSSLAPGIFTLTTGAGGTDATFEGALPAGDGGTYVAYYPATGSEAAVTNGAVTPPSVTGQEQTGNGSTVHLPAFTFMKAEVNNLASPLVFQHQMALLTFDFTLPDTYNSSNDEVLAGLVLSAGNNVFYTTTDNTTADSPTATLLLKDVTIDTDKKLKAYMMITGGTTLSAQELTFTLTSNKCTYTYTTGAISTTYDAGSRYTATVGATEWSAVTKDFTLSGFDNNGSMTNDIFANEKDPGIDGTSADKAYVIANAGQLALLAERINGDKSADWNTKFYKLTKDIDLAAAKICGDATTMGGTAKNWMPIGGANGKPFKGTFDGGSHTVSGLYIDNTDMGINLGFFGNLAENAVVKDLAVAGSIKSTQSFPVGGITGGAGTSSILGCSFEGEITNAGITGGIAGDVTNSFIAGCWHTGDVTGTTVGGIVGKNTSTSTIVGCSNQGDITATVEIGSCGGILGMNTGGGNAKIDLFGCCSVGDMAGGRNKGGIIGSNSSYDRASVDWCYFVKGSGGTPDNLVGNGSVDNVGGSSSVTTDITKQTIMSLNGGIDDWNIIPENANKQCNYHYVAGNPATSVIPVIVAGRPF